MTTLLIAIAVVVVLAVVGINVLGAGLSILWMLLLGLVIGALARLIVPGRQSMGVLLTAVVGAAGALLGGLLATEVFSFGDLGQFLLSVVVAAVLVVAVAGLDRGRQHGGGRSLDRA